MDLYSAFKASNLLPLDGNLIIACSGGVDSMVLLNLTSRLTKEYPDLSPIVAHFNHSLRGEESDSDESLVKEAAAELGLPFKGTRIDIHKAAKERKESIELTARVLRHDFLADIAKEHKAFAVALAHHQDDQVETLLMRLVRGTGGNGLEGIKPASPSPSSAEITLIRPLLSFSKAEIESHARSNTIRFNTDSSNNDTEIDRNWVRKKIIPTLDKLGNGRFPNTFLRSMQISSDENNFVKGEATHWLAKGFNSGFQKLPIALRRQIVFLQLQDLNVSPRAQLIDALLEETESTVVFPENKVISLDDYGECRLIEQNQSSLPTPIDFDPFTSSTGVSPWGQSQLRWRMIEPAEAQQSVREKKQGAHPSSEWLSIDNASPPFQIRTWKDGDRYSPLGLKGTTKLKDAFISRKIPNDAKRHAAILIDAKNTILWVQHLLPSQEAAVTSGSEKILKLDIESHSEDQL